MLVERVSCCVWRPVARWAVAASSRPILSGPQGAGRGHGLAELWSLSCGRQGASTGLGLRPGSRWSQAGGCFGFQRAGKVGHWADGRCGEALTPRPKATLRPRLQAPLHQIPGLGCLRKQISIIKMRTLRVTEMEKLAPKSTELANGGAEL